MTRVRAKTLPRAGDSGPQWPETPGLVAQTASFQEGAINTPLIYSYQLSSSSIQCTSRSTFKSSPNLRFLPIHPPNSLILGGLKEKAPIYIFTKPFFISPSFTWDRKSTRLNSSHSGTAPETPDMAGDSGPT